MKRMISKYLSVVFLCLVFLALLYPFQENQQAASTVEPPRTVDLNFSFPNPNPLYPTGKGPVVLVDEGHNNFHSAVTTYLPFARLLTDWVMDGGSLFIITDHMPDPAAVAELAAAFGIWVNNGYAFRGLPPGRAEPLIFQKEIGTLADHPLTSVGQEGRAIKQIATFAGSAFKASPEFEPLLIFERGVRTWMPTEYRKYPAGTPNEDVSGWYQGGVREFGKGRIAFFSEAAMFTAQVFDVGLAKVGMNHTQCTDNAQLLLNIIHWLSKKE